MTRLRIGVILLAVLLAGGILSAGWMASAVRNPAASLEEARIALLRGEISQGTAQAAAARESWTHSRRMAAALEDHAPLDDIDCRFCALETYLAAGEAEEAAVLCGELAALLSNLGDAALPNWWNLL